MPVDACRPPADLERLFLGGLPMADAEALEQHVLECNACSGQLDQLFRAKETLAGVLSEKTRDDSPGNDPAVADLIRKLETLRSANGPRPMDNAMITITCASCQKKLSVKEADAGKKVKCPGCGQVAVVPAVAAVGAASKQEGSGAAPGRDLPTIPPSQPDAIAAPTHPNAEPHHATLGVAPAPGHDASLTDFLAPPQSAGELGRLGKYRILKVLGHGGMGVVYQAEDPKLERSVAIKAMLPALAASASAGKRFLREAQAMAKVEHDHVVRIYQVEEDRGVPFMAMEFLKGEPLDQRLKRDQQLPLNEVVRIGREIAEALGAAHATGLIHRDVKPGNVWLEAPRQRVKILDFGLARAASQEAGLTQQGAIIGTPAYMAPEQARGDTVDGRCDLFSLGVVLYRTSTGQQPFHGKDTISTLMAVAIEEPAAPATLNKALPPEFSDLVMKLLEKDPARRFASAAEVVQALEAIEKKLARQPMDQTEATPSTTRASRNVAARREDATTTESPPRRRSKVPIAVALLVFGVLAVVAGVVFYWQTSDGTVRIEINDPMIQIAFDDKALLFKGIDKQDVRVTPGEHGLHVKRGDLELDSDRFILKKGETITLKVEWLKAGKLQVVQGETVLGAKTVVPIPVAASYALAFDGAKSRSRVVVPTLSYHGDHPLTVEAWAVFERPAADPTPEVLLGDPESAGFSISNGSGLTIAPGGRWSFHAWVVQQGNYVRAWEKQPVPRKRLVHVAGVYDPNSEVRFYVNGQLQERTPAKGKYKPSSVPFALGANPNPDDKFSDHFLGRLQGLRVSRVARYDNDFTPPGRLEPDKDTLVLYRFDEGKGDVLTDASGNNHHGKIVGARWVKAEETPSPFPPLDPAWLKMVAAQPAEQQVEAVRAELVKRNPGLDASLVKPKIEGRAIVELECRADALIDISPVRAFTELRALRCASTERAPHS